MFLHILMHLTKLDKPIQIKDNLQITVYGLMLALSQSMICLESLHNDWTGLGRRLYG